MDWFIMWFLNPQYMIDVDNIIKNIKHDQYIWDIIDKITNYITIQKNHIKENLYAWIIQYWVEYEHILILLELIEAKINMHFHTSGGQFKNQIYDAIEDALSHEIFQETMIWKDEMDFIANESD